MTRELRVVSTTPLWLSSITAREVATPKFRQTDGPSYMLRTLRSGAFSIIYHRYAPLGDVWEVGGVERARPQIWPPTTKSVDGTAKVQKLVEIYRTERWKTPLGTHLRRGGGRRCCAAPSAPLGLPKFQERVLEATTKVSSFDPFAPLRSRRGELFEAPC
jgi:hypothetical protein